MKKTILIIRSVSFQQLDKNLTAIARQFPTTHYRFQLLTHSHGIDRARSYTAISDLIDYDSPGNFSFFHLPRSLKRKEMKARKQSYEAIIVPVTNITGTGFLNVLALTLRIRTKKIFICNLVSDIRETSKVAILRQILTAGISSLLAAVATVPLAVIALPYLLISLVTKKKPENNNTLIIKKQDVEKRVQKICSRL